ncbi:MAG: cob(I)yrinic acid a,c-diamide adenosyltransferase [Syntrophobacterales bacterium]|jgi:cob(I)alamin adenosyltransferase|nr:cob(I)yrinic acid a,c-diamide adenosyltransferase [Syntrophobacterales bacterium]
MNNRGYIIVLTGNGKGKTTSALGMAMRAVGQDLKVIMLQFIKGSWRCGEHEIARRLGPCLTIRQLGGGFVNAKNQDHEDVNGVAEAWAVCKGVLSAGEYDMVILDEINNALAYGLLPADDVLDALRQRPAGLHVVLTGRDAHPRLIEAADIVTEFNEVKHVFQNGEAARKGIEY